MEAILYFLKYLSLFLGFIFFFFFGRERTPLHKVVYCHAVALLKQWVKNRSGIPQNTSAIHCCRLGFQGKTILFSLASLANSDTNKDQGETEAHKTLFILSFAISEQWATYHCHYRWAWPSVKKKSAFREKTLQTDVSLLVSSQVDSKFFCFGHWKFPCVFFFF